jgi:hypothetical protein
LAENSGGAGAAPAARHHQFAAAMQGKPDLIRGAGTIRQRETAAAENLHSLPPGTATFMVPVSVSGGVTAAGPGAVPPDPDVQSPDVQSPGVQSPGVPPPGA